MVIMLGIVAMAAGCTSTAESIPVVDRETEIILDAVIELEYETEMVAEFEPEFSNEKLERIGALADGIRHITSDGWYVCGNHLSEEDADDYAILIATAIVENIDSIGANISPWGILGTMYNESGFDHCAIGKHPRQYGQSLGLLPKKRRTISMCRDDVLKFIKHPKAKKRFKKTGYDLGLCQILSRFYPGETESILSVDAGVRICVLEMASRAKMYDTTTPWLYWRGSKTKWYRAKVRRWARVMGARKSDLKLI